MVYRVGEPGDREFELPFNGFDVFWAVRVPGVPVVAVEGDSDFAAVFWLEFLTEELDSGAVGAEEGVAREPGFGAAVADGVDVAVAGAAWGVFADGVAEAGGTEWLVESYPILLTG